MRAWTQAHAIAFKAAEENRDFTAAEQAAYDAHVTEFERLDTEIRTQPAPVATTPRDLAQQRLDLEKQRGQQITSEIQAHDARMRQRELDRQLTSAEQHERRMEWDRTLEHQRRMGELTDSLIEHHKAIG